MPSGKAKIPVGRPFKKEPITERKFNLYRLLLAAPHIPESPHWHPPIIKALIQRFERRLPSEARYVKYLLRLMSIVECLEDMKNQSEPPLMKLSPPPAGLLTFLAERPVPKTKHDPWPLEHQRDFLLFYLEGEHFPFNPRNGVAQKKWLQEHEEEIVRILKCFPCLCTYNDSISRIDFPKLTKTSSLSRKQLTLRILANLHRSTEGGIEQYLKPTNKPALK